jgi:hypothetical protein
MADELLARLLIAERRRERERQRLIQEAERARAVDAQARRRDARAIDLGQHRVARERRQGRRAA